MVLTAPGVIVAGEKAMVKPGREASTVKVALGPETVPTLVDKSPVVLLWLPAVAEVTFTLNVQLAFLLSL